MFCVDVRGVGRGPDIGVDLRAKALAYSAGLKRVVDGIGGNDDGAVNKAGEYRFYSDSLRASDVFRLWRGVTFSGTFDKSHASGIVKNPHLPHRHDGKI